MLQTPATSVSSSCDGSQYGSQGLDGRIPTPDVIQVSSKRFSPLETCSIITSSDAVLTTAVSSAEDNVLTYSSGVIQQAALIRAHSMHEGGTIRRRPKGSSAVLVRSSSDGGSSSAKDEEEDLEQEQESLSYTLYAYEDGIPKRSTTLIHHPTPTPPASFSIKHYNAVNKKRRPQHTMASAFTVVPKRSQQKTPETSPNASTPVREPEPIEFAIESPADEPDDALYTPYYYYAKAALQFWHAKAAREDFSQPIRQPSPSSNGKSNCSSNASDSDSVSYKYCKSASTRSYRVGSRSSGSAGASPEEGTSEATSTTTKNTGTSLLDSESKRSSICSKREVAEEQLVDLSTDSDTLYETTPLEQPRTQRITSIDDLPIIPLSPPISVDEDPEIRRAMQRRPSHDEGEAILLDSSPKHTTSFPLERTEDVIDIKSGEVSDFSPEDIPTPHASPASPEISLPSSPIQIQQQAMEVPEITRVLEQPSLASIQESESQEESSYDAKDDPHLWPGWWKTSGEVDEKLAATVPTQPDSPSESPRHQVSCRNISASTSCCQIPCCIYTTA